MNGAAAVFVLAPALALGSFLNVVVARVPARRSLLRPPSSCGSCEREILWRDNIPVLSYFLLRGRCRHCSARISPLYPAVEAVTAVLAVACVAVFGPTAYGALAIGFCALLVTLSVIDAEHRLVPNRIVLPAFALVARRPNNARSERRVAPRRRRRRRIPVPSCPRLSEGARHGRREARVGAGRDARGDGGGRAVRGLLAALVPAVVLFARHGSAARKMAVPLVPFLSLGAVIALFFGERLLDRYLGLF